MLDPDSIPRLMSAGTIEIAPLAYMRGRASRWTRPVLTPDGFRPIGTLTVGDLVIGSDGEPTPVIGVYPQGEKDIYRRHRPGRRLHAGLGRPPVGRDHPRRPPPRQAAPGPDHPRDDRQPAREPLPPVRVAAAQRAGPLPVPGSPDGPVRAGPAARRRLLDRDSHPELRHQGSGAGVRAEAAAAGNRCPAQARPRLQAEPAHVALERHHPWKIR